jgi:hypothetical protein
VMFRNQTRDIDARRTVQNVDPYQLRVSVRRSYSVRRNIRGKTNGPTENFENFMRIRHAVSLHEVPASLDLVPIAGHPSNNVRRAS